MNSNNCINYFKFDYRKYQPPIFQPLGFSAVRPLFSLPGCIPWPKGTNGGGPSPLTVKRECLAKVCEKKLQSNPVYLNGSTCKSVNGTLMCAYATAWNQFYLFWKLPVSKQTSS